MKPPIYKLVQESEGVKYEINKYSNRISRRATPVYLNSVISLMKVFLSPMSPHSTPRSVKGILKSPITTPNSLNLGLSRGPNCLTVAFESADGAWFHCP